MLRLGVRRDIVGVLRGAYEVSECRACSLWGSGGPPPLSVPA